MSPDEAAILMGAISVQARVVEVEELTQPPSVGVTTARPPLASARPTGVIRLGTLLDHEQGRLVVVGYREDPGSQDVGF